jgi:hypothetical protein
VFLFVFTSASLVIDLLSSLGTAGYGNDSWAIGESYADDPVLMPIMYDPNAPSGQKFSRDGLTASTIPRLYHSSATLLPDGMLVAEWGNDNLSSPILA